MRNLQMRTCKAWTFSPCKAHHRDPQMTAHEFAVFVRAVARADEIRLLASLARTIMRQFGDDEAAIPLLGVIVAKIERAASLV